MESNQEKHCFQQERQNVIIRPKVCEQINSNEIILFGQKRKNNVLPKYHLLNRLKQVH